MTNPKKQPEITPEMVEAGKRALFQNYNSRFDPLENDSASFVTTLFWAMEEARHQGNGLGIEHH